MCSLQLALSLDLRQSFRLFLVHISLSVSFLNERDADKDANCAQPGHPARELVNFEKPADELADGRLEEECGGDDDGRKELEGADVASDAKEASRWTVHEEGRHNLIRMEHPESAPVFVQREKLELVVTDAVDNNHDEDLTNECLHEQVEKKWHGVDEFVVAEHPEGGDESAEDADGVDVELALLSIGADGVRVSKHARHAANGDNESDNLPLVRLEAATVAYQHNEDAEHRVADVSVRLDQVCSPKD
mmetsp:Transcript_25724/g.34365  ORF Transcript_25724/g.34365 Transcript_25724/m.34365 type:complete len:248 (+) Transcript_25724:84-827(+)